MEQGYISEPRGGGRFPPCEHRHGESPENPAYKWCLKYGINLDHACNLCRMCQARPDFRHGLETYASARAARSCPGGFAYCERFAVAAGPEICARCRSDPGYRALLAGQRGARPTPRNAVACPHRGAVVKVEPRICCGGRMMDVFIHACALHGEAAPETCGRCFSENV